MGIQLDVFPIWEISIDIEMVSCLPKNQSDMKGKCLKFD